MHLLLLMCLLLLLLLLLPLLMCLLLRKLLPLVCHWLLLLPLGRQGAVAGGVRPPPLVQHEHLRHGVESGTPCLMEGRCCERWVQGSTRPLV